MKTTQLLFTYRTIVSIFLCGLFFSCKPGESQMKITHIDDHLTEIEIINPTRYLLIPIQDTAPEIKVWMQFKKEETLPMNIRLAQNKIEHYIPYELPKEKKVIIKIAGGKYLGKSWENIQLSDTFNIQDEKYRPVYHFTPPYGWMNDPNGLVYLEGEYHLFYQHNPYGSVWGNMHWGHAVSKNLFRWTHLPVAISPDTLGTIFSGNCIVDQENLAGFGKNAIIAYYTSAGKQQSQSIAYSTDKGRTFHTYEKNPIVTADIPDFRDPNVFYHAPSQKWIMIIAAGQEIRFYSSVNLLDWEYESSFGEGYGNHGGVWECPDLFELPIGKTNHKKWVLIVNINPGGPFGGSATQYFTGEFDGKRFICESEPKTEKWMDWGKDHYATITWHNAPINRRIALGWMSNWEYANELPTKQFRSATTIPRKLGLYTENNETYIKTEPIVELVVLRKTVEKVDTFTVENTHIVEPILPNNEGAYELLINFKNVTADVFGFTLANKRNERVDIYYDRKEKRFCMNRTNSGLKVSDNFEAITSAPIERESNYTLRIFVDKCSIECFDEQGKFVMTNLVFPSVPYNEMHFYTKGGTVEVESIFIFKLEI